MTLRKGRGVVLAFHCVPWDVEPAIEQFWLALRVCLQEQGQELLLISTVPIHNKGLPVLEIPFNLPDFDSELLPYDSLSHGHLMVQILQDWYKISYEHAVAVNLRVRSFISGLLNSWQPAAVLSWQSANPMSRMVREACQARDIAWWAVERGWINKTLMFDLFENNVLSEVNRSMVIQRTMGSYKPSNKILKILRKRSSAITSAARYPEAKGDASLTIRAQLGLEPDVPIWALFTHGEPHIHTLSSRMQLAHGVDASMMQNCLRLLASELSARGSVLLVREHPFNRQSGKSLILDGLSNVYPHEGDLDELLEVADVALFTLTTLQFEWALRGKPFGLLCQGLLSGEGMAPQWNEYPSPQGFVQACLDANAWPSRLEAIQRRIAYLFEFQLVDLLSSSSLRESARDLAQLLSIHYGTDLNEVVEG